MVLTIGSVIALGGAGLVVVAGVKNIRAHGWGKADLFWQPGRWWFVAGLTVWLADLAFIFLAL
ncbi:hypothetical protein L3i23_22100 [Herbiconiux sp. L3-i23]|nr:hypothetical protein L3i23_22100 [Herbiconiux sp. L3-i23]